MKVHIKTIDHDSYKIAAGQQGQSLEKFNGLIERLLANFPKLKMKIYFDCFVYIISSFATAPMSISELEEP